MVLISELLSRPLSFAFVGYDADLLDMTVHGFRLFALCYFFCGINIYASAFFYRALQRHHFRIYLVHALPGAARRLGSSHADLARPGRRMDLGHRR